MTGQGGSRYKLRRPDGSEGGRRSDYVASAVVFLGSIIICLLYKLTFSDRAQVTMKMRVSLALLSLTPRCRVLLEKLTGSQPVKKFPAFYGTRRFTTALSSVRHLFLSWTRSVQFPGCCCKWTWPIQAPNTPRTASHVPSPLLRSHRSVSPGPRQIFMILKCAIPVVCMNNR